MTVDDCIKEYIQIMEGIWKTESQTNIDSAVLKDNMARLAGANGEETFYDNNDQLCRV